MFILMANYLFKGFSSFGFGLANKSMLLSGIDLIKRDILNGLFTVKGSVHKNRLLGTSIPNLLMKQMTSELVTKVQQEVLDVLSNEPRISLTSLLVTPDQSTKTITVTITFTVIDIPYVPEILTLYLNFTG